MTGERVVVDTTVWSLLLRRRFKDLSAPDRQMVRELKELVISGQAILLGMVRFELLSGISDAVVFERLSDHLHHFEDIVLDHEDYKRGAAFWNRCKSSGIAASTIDMVICSVAAGRDLKILTADRDFSLYARHLPIELRILSSGA